MLSSSWLILLYKTTVKEIRRDIVFLLTVSILLGMVAQYFYFTQEYVSLAVMITCLSVILFQTVMLALKARYIQGRINRLQNLKGGN